MGKEEGRGQNDRTDGSMGSRLLTCLSSFGMINDDETVKEIERHG